MSEAAERGMKTRRDVTEAFQHIAVYSGVPKTIHAIRLARATLAEMDQS